MTSSRLVGTIIENKYSLDEQIGHGGMGAVYRGTQLMVDRTVAIKLLQSEFASHDSFKARFEVEAKAIGRMNHPNCITLFDFGYSQNIEAFYTVVEYIQGRTLDALLSDNASLTTIVGVMRQIASGLDHAHHHGILHRDLKPENIMLAQMTDGTEMVKVLDFGIAQIVKGSTDSPQTDSSELYAPMDDDFDEDRITRVGEVFGTPPYMSPEQARSTRNLTPACDLYSLGIMFYELVAGRLPFFSDNPLDILLMHINEPPPPIERLKSLPELHTIIMELLEKDPTQRIQSGQDLISKLDAIDVEFLEKESSLTPKKTILAASEQRVIVDAAPRSWVETVDTGEIPSQTPAFAPPPQAKHQTKPKHTPVAKTATASPPSSRPPADRQSSAFETVITFDDIDAQVATKKTTRWGLLFFLTACCGLAVFFMFKYEPELLEKLPFLTPQTQSTLQTPSATAQPSADTPDPLKTSALPDAGLAENTDQDTGHKSTTDQDTPYRPIPVRTSPTPAQAESTFPEPTRPATKKQQAKKSAKRPKKRSKTPSQKPVIIERDESNNPPSKGPRILEF